MSSLHCFCTWSPKWIMQIWVLSYEESSRLPLSGALYRDCVVSLLQTMHLNCSLKGLKGAWLHCASGYVPVLNIWWIIAKMLSSKCIPTLIVPLKKCLEKLLAKTSVNKALSVINQIYFAYHNCWFSASFGLFCVQYASNDQWKDCGLSIWGWE